MPDALLACMTLLNSCDSSFLALQPGTVHVSQATASHYAAALMQPRHLHNITYPRQIADDAEHNWIHNDLLSCNTFRWKAVR